MLYQLLTNEENKVVEKTINSLLGVKNFNQILHEKKIIKIKYRRDEVYLVDPTDLHLIEKFTNLANEGSLKLIHTKLKLGFFIQKNFMIGIEAIAFFASKIHKRIKLDKEDTERFIYGEDIEITESNLSDQLLKIEDGTIIMIFSSDDIPIGYARIETQNRKIRLQNQADIGIYLRSEKSAF